MGRTSAPLLEVLRNASERQDFWPEQYAVLLTEHHIADATGSFAGQIKHDGFRMVVRRDSAGVRLLTRRGNDWTERFPLIAAAAGALKLRSCLLDGEAVASERDGRPNDRLRNRPLQDACRPRGACRPTGPACYRSAEAGSINARPMASNRSLNWARHSSGALSMDMGSVGPASRPISLAGLSACGLPRSDSSPATSM
jgi:ATP dependent DNA ligase domain